MKPNTIPDLLGRTEIDPETKCWLYTGKLTKGGYAVVSYKGKMQCLHRLVYEDFVGPIPEGLQIDHVKEICPHRNCCNPFHLEPVTLQENLKRGKGNGPATAAAAELARAKSHCKKGHEFTPENTRIHKNGRRRCKTCERIVESRRVRPKKGRPHPTHCRRGHIFDSANTIYETGKKGNVKRRCRECHNAREREYFRRRKTTSSDSLP